MNAPPLIDLLREAHAHGVEVRLMPTHVVDIRSPAPLPKGLIKRLRTHEKRLLGLLLCVLTEQPQPSEADTVLTLVVVEEFDIGGPLVLTQYHRRRLSKAWQRTMQLLQMYHHDVYQQNASRYSDDPH